MRQIQYLVVCFLLYIITGNAFCSWKRNHFGGRSGWTGQHSMTARLADIHYWNKKENNFYTQTEDLSLQRAADETWKWAAKFVAPLNLCPWASASVSASNAIRIYVFNEQALLKASLELIAENFCEDIENGKLDANTAIVFCLLATPDAWDFLDFYDWFYETEDVWLDVEDENHVANRVTLAPFHPEWRFDSDETEDPLNIEKASPYPTVTIVSSETIENAGEVKSAQIVEHNARILQSKTLTEWKAIYERVVYDKD